MIKKIHFYAMNKARGAGFCSEINNILYAIYFFQKKGYSFKFISFGWVSSYDKGWSDYFDSLKLQHFSHSFNFKQTKYNLIFLNYLENNKKYLEKIYFIRILYKILRRLLLMFISKNCYIRGEKNFNEFRRFCYYDHEVNYDTFCLSINKILNNIWIIKPEIQKKIQKKIPENSTYIAIHIRRGDKITSKEDRKYETREYIDALLKLNLKTKVIFLLSDDYNSYIEMKEKLPNFKIITFLNKKQSGYSQSHFASLSKKDVKNETINFLTEIEIAKKSIFFIGSHRSNVFKLVKYFKLNNCIDISKQKITVDFL